MARVFAVSSPPFGVCEEQCVSFGQLAQVSRISKENDHDVVVGLFQLLDECDFAGMPPHRRQYAHDSPRARCQRRDAPGLEFLDFAEVLCRSHLDPAGVLEGPWRGRQ